MRRSQKCETPSVLTEGVRGGVVAATYSPWGLTAQVPLALRSLTAVFGMGTGVAFSLTPPQIMGWEPEQERDGKTMRSGISFDLRRGEWSVLESRTGD